MRALREAEQAAQRRVATARARRSSSAPRTFAAAVLDRLADSPHRPQLVVTRPDRPRGPRAQARRRRRSPTPARELGLELASPRTSTPRTRARGSPPRSPDVVVVCAFGALIREPLLSDHEMLNVHPSLLPRWRGAAPVERAIMAGDERDRRLRSCAPTAGLRQRPGLPRRHASRSRPTTRTARSPPRLQELGADLLSARSTSARSRSSSPRRA